MKSISITPSLLFGLSVETDFATGSNTLILTELSKLGYAIPYDEVTRYKQSSLHEQRSTRSPQRWGYPVCCRQHGA